MACSIFIWGFEFSVSPYARDFRETFFWLRFLSVFIFLLSDWVFDEQHKIKTKKQD